MNATMKPTEVLIHEHRIIEQVLNCLERMAEGAADPVELEAPRAAEVIAFLHTFVHGWHFPREEAFLTQAMDRLRESYSQDLEFHDHRRCGLHLEAMRAAAEASRTGDSQAAKDFADHAQAYIAVLMKHNEDEEDRLFPMIEREQAGRAHADVAVLPEQPPSRPVDASELAACIDAAHRLADHFNVPRAGGPWTQGAAAGSSCESDRALHPFS